MEIIKIDKSRISEVNFSNLTFGEEFTDHMFTCDYIDGKWINPKIVPYEKLKMDPSSSVLHYGQSVFEGMKAFKNNQGNILFFRRGDNFNRLNKSVVIVDQPSDLDKCDALILPGVGSFERALDYINKMVFQIVLLPFLKEIRSIIVDLHDS